MTTKPKVLIARGLGTNSHEELKHVFELAGAQAEYKLWNELIENPKLMDNYQGCGLPGGFAMGDHLGAGQSLANRIRLSGLKEKLEEKLQDPNYPMYIVCNSLQLLAKLDKFPIKVGTLRNDSGKHETGYWDIKINKNNNSIWLSYLKDYRLPIFAPTSHGEGRIYVSPEDLKIAEEQKLIALQYENGHLSEFFKSSRGDRYNPNGSTADIAGFAWNNNIVLFPHFERLYKNVQRPDRAEIDNGRLLPKQYLSTPDELYEPTYRMFKAPVDFMKQN